jgi:hypothetical protein
MAKIAQTFLYNLERWVANEKREMKKKSSFLLPSIVSACVLQAWSDEIEEAERLRINILDDDRI